MITKKFKEFNKPDLRQIDEVVLCIKNFYDLFSKGEYYKVRNFSGVPQGAIEKYGINDYLPVECMRTIYIIGNDGKKHEFWIHSVHPSINNFFKYFKIPEFTNSMKKYNL
jgi:hypothetical protein